MDMPPEELIDQVAKDVSGRSPVAERHTSDIVSIDSGEVTHDLARRLVAEDKPRVPFVGDASVAFDDRPVRRQKLCRAIEMQQFVLGPAALVTRHGGKEPCAPSHCKPPPFGIPQQYTSTPRGVPIGQPRHFLAATSLRGFHGCVGYPTHYSQSCGGCPVKFVRADLARRTFAYVDFSTYVCIRRFLDVRCMARLPKRDRACLLRAGDRDQPCCAMRITTESGGGKFANALRLRSISVGVRPPPRTGDALRGPMDMPPEESIDQVAKDVSRHSAAAERHASDIMSVDPGEVTHDLARELVTEDKPRVPFVGDASVAFDDRPVRCQKLCRTIKMQQFVLGPAALVTRHSGQRPCAPSH